MNDLNRLSLLGRVGADPETTTLKNGGMRASFSVATSNRWTDDNGQKQEKTQWHTVVAFNEMAKIVQANVQKGSQVMLEGPMEYRDYAKQDGAKGHAVEVVLRGAPGEMLRVTDRRKEVQPS